MKKLIIAIMVLTLAVLALGTAKYQYTGDDNVYIESETLETGDTIIVDYFMYDNDFTLVASTPTDILMNVTSVSTSSVATQTITMTELADVEVEVDFDTSNVSPVTVYFNSTDTEGIPISADWDMEINTKYFYQVILVNTATTTDYTAIVKKVF